MPAWGHFSSDKGAEFRDMSLMWLWLSITPGTGEAVIWIQNLLLACPRFCRSRSSIKFNHRAYNAVVCWGGDGDVDDGVDKSKHVGSSFVSIFCSRR